MGSQLNGQLCAICGQKSLALSEELIDVPHFGKTYIFSMSCGSCKFHKSDIEAAEQHPPARYTFEVNGKDDISVKIVKSSEATVKIPHIITITPGPDAEGYFTNVEGLLQRVISAIQSARDSAEDEEDKKKAKNLLKKLDKVIWGDEKLKIIIEDPSGNSAIISERAVQGKL
ncbi:MAG TPA: ZPR1 zinc finger domain-containing protein [Candidatus Nanoarchaeia archaeon]|nr:ZPR1 zinc finger domain-containing protein [Candidatus Nanoarchaeia archaeon]